jgi:hypothetical protein
MRLLMQAHIFGYPLLATAQHLHVLERFDMIKEYAANTHHTACCASQVLVTPAQHCNQSMLLLLLLLVLVACVPLVCQGRGEEPAAGEGYSPCSSTHSQQVQHLTCQLLGMIFSHFNKVPHIHSGVPSGLATTQIITRVTHQG